MGPPRRLVLAVLVLAALAGCASDDDDAACGGDGASCASETATCSTSELRCTCQFQAWDCEALACPVGDEVTGDACPTAGMQCGVGFEDPGSKCIGPELTWARCQYYHQAGDSPPNGCPPSPPTLGTPCCQALGNGGPPLGCLYGAEVIDCVNDHWVHA